MPQIRKSNKLISIIMPAYNVQEYINEAINSVINQTYSNWELIIVDDGSTDETAKIITKYQSIDKRIKYFYQQNGKQGKARNTGIKNSKGYYLAFLDADDLWKEAKLQIQIEIMENRPDIDLLFTQGFFLLPDGTDIPFYITVKEWNWVNDSDIFYEANQIPILSVVVKRDAVLAVNSFTENMEIQNAEDYHLWLKLLKKGNFLSIAEKLFFYRIHPQQVTYNDRSTAMAVANCYSNLISLGIVSGENKVIRKRIKWLIFQSPYLDHYFEILKMVFTEKMTVLTMLSFLNKIWPNKMLIKKITFKAL